MTSLPLCILREAVASMLNLYYSHHKLCKLSLYGYTIMSKCCYTIEIIRPFSSPTNQCPVEEITSTVHAFAFQEFSHEYLASFSMSTLHSPNCHVNCIHHMISMWQIHLNAVVGPGALFSFALVCCHWAIYDLNVADPPECSGETGALFSFALASP